MADKRIDQLTAATSLGDSDLLVVDQESVAKKATGTVVSNYINTKFGLSGMASDISEFRTALAEKQDALTLPLSIAQGGTGATRVGDARVNLGLGSAAVADLDKTLSIDGAAAEAKAAGSAISHIKSALSQAFVNFTDVSYTLEQGGISTSGAEVSAATNRVKTATYIPIEDNILISLSNGVRWAARLYGSNNNFLSVYPSSGAWVTTSGTVDVNALKTANANAAKIRFVFSNALGNNITPADIAPNISIEYYHAVDGALTAVGKAAEASAVGERFAEINDLMSNHWIDYDYSSIGTTEFPLGWCNGYFNSTTGQVVASNHYIRTLSSNNIPTTVVPGATAIDVTAPDGFAVAVYEYDSDGTFITRHGNANNGRADATSHVSFSFPEGHIFGLVVGFLEDASAKLTSDFISQIKTKFYLPVDKSFKLENVPPDAKATGDRLDVLEAGRAIAHKTSNWTVVCAKETNYADGTPPSVSWYLVEDTENRFYITTDFSNLIYAFTFTPSYGNPFQYKFAVLPNNDIIAVFRSEASSTGSSDSANRQNPYVFLASEGWKTAHLVDFGSSLKPSGWLENCGFCPMPNGDAMFCEYTRPSVETTNCWKIHGDPTNPANWVVKKSFTLSGQLNEGIKHCHAVNYDFYTGVYYLCTGDDDIGAQVWYSTDDGESWTLAREPSEMYCRVLNMVFTPDYIYWASDTRKANMHYLFRCARDGNGIIDYSKVTTLADLYVYGLATYGLVYLENMNALVILDKGDAALTQMPFRIFDLSDNTLSTMAILETADGTEQMLGFRTEYSEFRPNGNYTICGFGKRLSAATYRNLMKMLGNAGDPNGWGNNVNNLRIEFWKDSAGFHCRFKTAFMPR